MWQWMTAKLYFCPTPTPANQGFSVFSRLNIHVQQVMQTSLHSTQLCLKNYLYAYTTFLEKNINFVFSCSKVFFF